MKTQFFKNSIKLFIFLTFAVAATHAANYSVSIDCNHSAISDTETANRISVSFLDRNRNSIRTVSKSGIRNCSQSDAVFSIATNQIVRFVRFATNGNDAFYIDEWRLFRDRKLIHREGSENGKGWCLSTDPRDAGRDWRGFVVGGCRTRLRFPVAVADSPSVGHYRVTVDCHHSSMKDTDTAGRISVSFLDKDRDVIRRVSKTGIRNCSRNEAGFSINTDRVVSYVAFDTNSNDAFYIDEWRLFHNGRLLKREGSDNGKGWCLSTDSRDADGAWKNYVNGGGCRSAWRFPVAVG